MPKIERKKAYHLSLSVCPVCGRNAVMRLFKCRCEDWYGCYALRLYCKNKECPVDHVCTEFFDDRESAEKRMAEYMVKEKAKERRRRWKVIR